MRVFISYASEDRGTAEAVHLALAGAGHTTFFDQANLPPGGDYNSRIAAAVKQCDAFIFLISPDSIAPGSYTLTELKLARSKWEHPKDHVLPVMARTVPFERLPTYLGAVTALVPEGNLAAEVAIALSELAAPGATPATPEASGVPSATILGVRHEHNVVTPSPMGPGPGMRITVNAELRDAARRTAQLVVRFAYANGPPLMANPQEMTFRDAAGLVAVGTPPRVLGSDRESLTEQVLMIPYYALNFQPTQGMAAYNLMLTAFVYVDNQIVAQSPPNPFGLRW
jgi:hypothetical protein